MAIEWNYNVQSACDPDSGEEILLARCDDPHYSQGNTYFATQIRCALNSANLMGVLAWAHIDPIDLSQVETR